MVAFYKHHILDWRGGTASLSDRAYRVYHVIVEQIMLNEGPIPYHDRTLAGLANRSTRDLRMAVDELVEAGKITVADGLISNKRASDELVGVKTNRENAAKGGRTPREQSANGRRTVRELSEKHNEINSETEATLHDVVSLKEKRREEKKEEPLSFPFAVAAPIGAAQPRTSARGSRLPQDWKLDTAGRAYATDRGFNGPQIDRMAERFANHWHSKTGKDACKMDWQATWRNWVLNEVERSPPTAQKTVWAQTA